MTWICERGAFIHIPKCAGHSVMEHHPGYQYKPELRWFHQRLSEVKAEYTWTIVRHPITRLVSYWLYEKRIGRTELECMLWLEKRKPKSMDWYLNGWVDEILYFENLPKEWPHLNAGTRKSTKFYTWNTDIEEYIINNYAKDFERFGYERTMD